MSEPTDVLPQPAPKKLAGRCYVGKLAANKRADHATPSGYCIDGQYYRGAQFRLSRMNLFGADDEVDGWVGSYVRLYAQRRSNLRARLTADGRCKPDEQFPVQARSDWAPEEGSYLTSFERLEGADYLEQSGPAEEVELLSVDAPEPRNRGRKNGAPPDGPIEQVAIEITNPFDFPLDGVQLVLHYEGGPGKPMPHYEEVKLSGLGRGQTRKLSRPAALHKPATAPRKGSAWWTFESVVLEGSAGGCTFLSSGYRR